MARTTRKRSTLANRAIAASAALILGGGGLIAVNVYASAGEGRQSPNRTQAAGQSVSTIDCPDVGNELKQVPKQERRNVDRELATLDTQITTAYQRFAELRQRIEQNPQYGQQQILTPLKNERTVILQRIAALIERGKAPKPQGLESMASCTLRADDEGQNQGGGQGQNGGNQNDGNGQGQNGGQGQDGDQNDGNGQGQDGGGQDGGGNAGQAGNGPEQSDFVEIQSVQPNAGDPRNRRGASRGVFKTSCGVNENGKFNPDNVIVAPGVANGAHHMHDYVGNQANDAFA
ncbi:DUF1996 domain-containing protein, partial [Streptomyces tirandamycinicus]|nr:hypothetical protein [Streptomyces tirandamycinicus]